MAKIRSVLIGSLFVCGIAAAADPAKVSFNQHIRPILANNCFQCHGPDEKKRDGDLRLDVREGAVEDRGGYAAITPGKPEVGALLERILSDDPDTMMPPPKTKKPRLSAEQIALLKRWISEGADYEGHWAFLPLLHSTPPIVQNSAWPRQPIDAFILAKLEEKSLTPSPDADRSTFLRRVSLDLIGLLPSPEETEAFINDDRPDAHERLVDRLLADPHYAERWGRHWLDQARYADSNGYSIDGERTQWPYRDWVLHAVGQDLPFDQFTLEQLAGDLLPNPTKNQLIATAFHRNTLINQEGGTDAEQFRNEAVVDRVNTTAAVWLGLTVACAQCHTHKYDPIPHQDYYRLFAFFNPADDANNKGPTIMVSRGEVFGRPEKLPPKVNYEPELAKLQSAWEVRELERQNAAAPPTEKTKWSPVKYLEYDTASGAGFQLLADNSLLADGRGAFNDTYRVTLTTDIESVAAVRLRVLTHDSLPKRGPGMAGNGNFVLTGVEVTVDDAPQLIRTAFADHEQPDYPILAALDNRPQSGWAINVGKGQTAKMNADHEAVFVFDRPLDAKGKTLQLKLKHEMNERYLIGRFDISVTAEKPAPPAAAASAPLVTALRTEAAKRSDEQQKTIREAFIKSDPEGRKLSELAAKGNEPDRNAAELMIIRDKKEGRVTHVLTRGDFLRPDKTIGPLAPGVLSAVQRGFPSPPTNFSNRIDLARWLVHPENPLTPRVTMNRVWMRYFGRGLVETEEDFGTQGTPPSHPELLDWLGRDFIRGGWSLQAMHRQLTTSAVYRQSSRVRRELSDIDPLNLLLARQARLRVEGEIVRDAALSAAGLLTRSIGGPSVHPPQPSGVYAFTQNQKTWKTPQDAERFRRGLYTFFYRSAPYPLLSTFDSPDFQTVCTKRVRSNTPLQSLTLANDPAFLEIAQGVALRVLNETPKTDSDLIGARLQRAHLLTLQRRADERELQVLKKYFTSQAAAFAAAPSDAQAFAPAQSASAGAPPAEAAALVAVARVLLNTDAFITRE